VIRGENSLIQNIQLKRDSPSETSWSGSQASGKSALEYSNVFVRRRTETLRVGIVNKPAVYYIVTHVSTALPAIPSSSLQRITLLASVSKGTAHRGHPRPASWSKTPASPAARPSNDMKGCRRRPRTAQCCRASRRTFRSTLNGLAVRLRILYPGLYDWPHAHAWCPQHSPRSRAAKTAAART